MSQAKDRQLSSELSEGCRFPYQVATLSADLRLFSKSFRINADFRSETGFQVTAITRSRAITRLLVLTFVPRLHQKPLVRAAACSRITVNYSFPFPLVGNDVTRLVYPDRSRSWRRLDNAWNYVFSGHCVSARITVAPEIDRAACVHQLLEPVSSARTGLPHSQPGAVLGFRSRWRCAVIPLPVNTDVPTQHPWALPTTIRAIIVFQITRSPDHPISSCFAIEFHDEI